jgi:hypothetical protein
MRQVNVNAPMVASSVGTAPDPLAAFLAPRPIAVNENIFRYEQLAHRRGGLVEFALEQNSYKRFNFSADYLHLDFRSDGGFRLGDLLGAPRTVDLRRLHQALNFGGVQAGSHPILEVSEIYL